MPFSHGFYPATTDEPANMSDFWYTDVISARLGTHA